MKQSIRSQRKILSSIVSVVLFLSLGLFSTTAFAVTYYVDATNGNDQNSGTTIEEPWKTFWRTVWTNNVIPVAPGDQVLFKRGETWREFLWATTKGTPENLITYGAYGDENDPLPLFDGTFSGDIAWEHVEGNIYRTTTEIWDKNVPKDPGIIIYDGISKPSIATLAIDPTTPVSQVQIGAVLIQRGGAYCNLWVTSVDETNNTVSGITFFRHLTNHWFGGATIEVRQLNENNIEEKFELTLPETGGLSVGQSSLTQPGHWYWDAEEAAHYLYSDSDLVNNSDVTVEVGQIQYGLLGNQVEHLAFQDLAIRGFREAGVYLSMSNNISLSNIHVSQIGANGHKTGILFSNTKNSTISNSTVDSVLANGIAVYAMSPDYELYNSKNNVIENNTITSPGSAGIMLNTDFLMQAENVADNIVTGNTIENANSFSYDAAGIYMLNSGPGNQLLNNTVRNGGSEELRSGGIMVDGGVAPVIIDGNILENNSLGGIDVTGEGHQITYNILRNNGVTSWESAQVVFFSATVNASGCTVENNTMEAGEGQMLFTVLNGKPGFADERHVIDNNDYTAGSATPFCWNKNYVCDEPIDFATWQCASGALTDLSSTLNGIDPEDPLYCGEPPEDDTPCEEISPPEVITTYYVDATEGDDSNTGTSEGQAWKSLIHVNGAAGNFGPGDQILFKRGETWHDQIWFRSSGERCYPIEFGAYGDPGALPPMIDGSYSGFPLALQWEHVEGDIYRTTQPSWNSDPGLVIYKGSAKPSVSTLSFDSSTPVDGVKIGAILLQLSGVYCNLWVTSVDTANNTVSGITYFRTPDIHWVPGIEAPIEVRQLDASGKEEKFFLILADPGGLSAAPDALTQPGHWYWDESDQAIYLFSYVDPNTISVELGQRQWGFVTQFLEYLSIHDLSFRGAKEVGTYFFGCKGFTVNNVHISNVGANGHNSGILLHNTKRSTISNNTVESVLVNGIVSYAFSPGLEYNCNNNIISDNLVRNSGSAGIMMAAETLMQAEYINDTTISGNTVENANTWSYDSAGIYAANINYGNKILANTVRNGGSRELRSAGIMIDGAIPAVIMNENFIENNSLGGIAVTGDGHQITANSIQNNGVPSWESAQLIFFTAFRNATGCEVNDNIMTAGSDQSLFMVLNGKPSASDDPHLIDNNTYASQSLSSFCWNDSYVCEQAIDFETWKLTPDIDTDGVVDQNHDDNSTFTQADPVVDDSIIYGSEIPGVSQSLVPEEDKSRLYIKQEIPGPGGTVHDYYVPQEYELEITEMDIIDNPRIVEAMLAGKFWNGHGYVVSIGLRHPDMGENMYIAIPMADPWNGWPILFHQGAGETVWQRDTISRIVGSTSDSVLVKVNRVGLFTAAYITEVQDNDGDGHSVAQGDCNDNNPDIYPGAMEVCDNQTDDNCNGQVDENCIAIETVFKNGLEWQKVGQPGQFTHSQAVAYCNSFAGPGSTGWRLPDKEELKGLVVCTNGTATPLADGTTCGTGYWFPTIDPEFSCHNSRFWAATAEGSDFWSVSFYTGSAEPVASTSTGNVRCVRTL
ncbi:MAG: right-handed parallel beta-helix repeat-containing protein [Thermodesulfobacteriota bacterium]|nr:right-handed parallel beta-helix repeat-containing protein [Thermodesulfobacteriota bacterium]